MCALPRPLDFEPFLEEARVFLGRFHDPPRHPKEGIPGGAFASRPDGPCDLYGAADAAYALWVLGDLDACTMPDGRRRWAARIQSYQNGESGWFDRGLLPGHGAPHATAFATGALVLLGSRPLHPLRYAEGLFGDRARVDAWLDGFRWSQVWTGSHAAGAAAAVLDAPQGLELPEAWADTVLAALGERLDPRTGFWKRALHDRVLRRPTTLDLGGAAHFWWLFDRCGRPIPRPEQAADGILALQRRSGLWGSRLFGGAFPQGIDFDALHGLRVAWRDASGGFRRARRERLARALERYTGTAHAMLTARGAVARLFRAPHKLVGTLNALAELDALAQAVFGHRCTAMRRPLRSALTRVSWQ